MNRWQKYIDICNMINFWLALYWRKRKSRWIERYDLSLMKFPVLGVAGTWVNVCKAVLPRTFDGTCKDFAYMSFHFSVAAVCSDAGKAHCRVPSCRDTGCMELPSTATLSVLKVSTFPLTPFTPLPSPPHTPSLKRRVSGWIALSFQRKGQIHWEKGRRSTIQYKKVSSEPNKLQGGQAEHVLSKEGLCKIPDKILAVWQIPWWSVKSAAPAQDEKYPTQPASAVLERQLWTAQPPAVSFQARRSVSAAAWGDITSPRMPGWFCWLLVGWRGSSLVRSELSWEAGWMQDTVAPVKPLGKICTMPLAPESGFPPLLPIHTNPPLPWPCW